MIKTINPVSSMMSFNTRVLHTAKQHISSNIEELQKAVFFASVYQSNCDELFCRESHASPSLVDRYRKNATLFNQIIRDVILRLRDEVAWFTQDIIPPVYLELHPMLRSVEPYQNVFFRTGWLYYVTTRNDEITIRGINPNDVVYQEPIVIEGDVFKVDRAILEYFKFTDRSSQGLVFRVTTEEHAPMMIHKVEYWGDEDLLDPIVDRYFRHTELVMMNPFLYIGDIERILAKQLPERREMIEPANLCMNDIFEKDRLIEYPRQSFDNYLDLLREASESDGVEEINMTMYRIGQSYQLLVVLANAVDHGIRVNVHLEMFANGEDINQIWYKLLEDHGINVYTYYPGTIKVHAKLTLIEFKNGDMITQIGTGNYHTKTTLQYTDLMLFTADDVICCEAKSVFNLLMRNEVGQCFDTIDFLVSRYNARIMLVHFIDQEAAKGGNGMILFKMNALDDPTIIEHLSLAEEAGCKICLICRGKCTWLPNHIGENVEIRSMIWDKLEHSRVYSFGRENPTIYMGSMDLVESKIDYRIETLCRLDDPDIILWMTNYLNRYATETKNVWVMDSTGSYHLKED